MAIPCILLICPFNNLYFIKCLNQFSTFHQSVKLVIDRINSNQTTGIENQQYLFMVLVYIFTRFKNWWCKQEGIIKIRESSDLLTVEIHVHYYKIHLADKRE